MWKSIKAIIIFYIAQFVCVFPLALLSRIAGFDILTAFMAGLLVADVALVLYFRSVWGVRIASGEPGRHSLPTISLCVCIAPLLTVVSAVLAAGLDLPDTIGLPLEDIPFPLALAGIGVLGPVAEEVVFRGGVLGSLLKWERIGARPWVAVLISALLFSVAHFNPGQAPVTVLLGLVTGWLYVRTGSLVPGMALHIMNNSAVCATLAIPEGSDLYVALEEWEPSVALLMILLAAVLTLSVLVFHFLAKVVDRDYPDRGIWSSADPDAGPGKRTAWGLGICSGIMVAAIAFLSVQGVRRNAMDDLLYSFEDFHDGLARVRMDGDWEYIDKDGNIVDYEKDVKAEPLFEGQPRASVERRDGYDVYNYHDGLAMVSKDGLYGFMNEEGRLLVPVEYESATLFRDGVSIVSKDGKYGSIDSRGVVVIPLRYDSLRAFGDSLFIAGADGGGGSVLLDFDGDMLKEFDYILLSGLNGGFAHARKDGKDGFVNSSGDVAIPFIYDSAAAFSDGLARVCKGMRRYYIDTSGSIVIELD